MAAQWPLLVTRLLTLLPTLPGWDAVKLFDGPPVDDNVTALYCTVGHVDGDLAGNYRQSRDSSGGLRVEVGEVKCQLVSQDQRNNLPAARAKLFPLADAVEAAWRADYTLGILPSGSTVDLICDVDQQQTASGPFVSLIFTFSYSTLT